jgi:hypothetical protein
MIYGCDVKPDPFGIAVPHVVKKDMISPHKKRKRKERIDMILIKNTILI